ncbi:MAG TPA: EamA family transporter RarD, partial [Candidatus Dormibacteraeota bacterium]|nr:EamA family transporter RarD [Candidatus Dormibacteraeota bacterium]
VLAGLTLTALLISANWVTYVWSVAHGHIVDASLGYYINPLVNVLLGVLVLRERLNGAQWAAVLLAALAVAYLTLLGGHAPWIAAVLAVSFSLYGFLRKTLSVDALPGLTIETLLLAPLAAGYLVWCQLPGSGSVHADTPGVDALLLGSGVATAVPLTLFAYGARALRYSTVGVLQYLAPTGQLLCGVVVFGERFDRARGTGFALLWVALAIYALDGIVRSRAAARAAPA